MEIGSLQNVGTGSNSDNGTVSQTLNKNDFLQLLVAQLENQDPLKPTDPTKFTEQLAQFSSLEQLYNINDSMKGFENLSGSVDRLSALSLIDKCVTSVSDTFPYEGQPLEIGFDFQTRVQEAKVLVKDENGRTVCQIDVENPSAGEHFLTWNGIGQDGERLPEGEYTFEAIGTTLDGEVLNGSPLIKSRITGVDFADSSILTTNGTVDFLDIVKVNNSTLEDESRTNKDSI